MHGLAMTLTFDLNTLLRIIGYKPLTTWHFVKYKLNGIKGTENMLKTSDAELID